MMRAALLGILKMHETPIFVNLVWHQTFIVSCGVKVSVLPTNFSPSAFAQPRELTLVSQVVPLFVQRNIGLSISIIFPWNHSIEPQAVMQLRVAS